MRAAKILFLLALLLKKTIPKNLLAPISFGDIWKRISIMCLRFESGICATLQFCCAFFKSNWVWNSSTAGLFDLEFCQQLWGLSSSFERLVIRMNSSSTILFFSDYYKNRPWFCWSTPLRVSIVCTAHGEDI